MQALDVEVATDAAAHVGRGDHGTLEVGIASGVQRHGVAGIDLRGGETGVGAIGMTARDAATGSDAELEAAFADADGHADGRTGAAVLAVLLAGIPGSRGTGP